MKYTTGGIGRPSAIKQEGEVHEVEVCKEGNVLHINKELASKESISRDPNQGGPPAVDGEHPKFSRS